MSAVEQFVLDKIGKPGYFVDVGASDGFNDSNTLQLEQAGWNGICIDALERNYTQLVRKRKCYCEHAVIAAQNGVAEFVSQSIGGSNGFGGSGMTAFMPQDHLNFIKWHLGGRISKVQTVTLISILQKYFAPNHIQFLDIDVEGAAYNVIQNFPFNKYIFDYINIEAGGRVLLDIQSLLSKYNYVEIERYGEMDSLFELQIPIPLTKWQKLWKFLMCYIKMLNRTYPN